MRICCFFLPLVLFFCCQKNNKVGVTDLENVANIEIKEYPFSDNKFLDPNKYFDSIRYVLLEETEESRVPTITELFFTDSLIIVASKSVNSIFFFDINGKYLRKINRRGRGPGEYLTLAKVMVDEELRRVIVYDVDTRKMLYYDFKGKHLKTVEKFADGAVVRDLINLHDGRFLCYNPSYSHDNKRFPTGVWRVDSSGRFEKFFYEITEEYPSKFSRDLFYLSYLNDGVIGFIDFNTTNTYHIVNDAQFCRSRYKMPDKTMADYAGIKNAEDLLVVTDYQEKGDFVFVCWGLPDGRGATTALSKSDNSVEMGVTFFSMMSKYLMLSGNFVRNNRPNICTSIFNYEAFKPFMQNVVMTERFKDILNKIAQTNNPIVQISYVKFE